MLYLIFDIYSTSGEEPYNEYRASYQSQLFEYSEENKELHKLVNKMLKMERHEVAYLYMQYLENKIDGIRS